MRNLQIALFVITLMVGAYGWFVWLGAMPGDGSSAGRWVDAVYRSIQLFLGNFDRPEGINPKLPIPLQVARFIAPIVTIWAVVELITGELSIWPGAVWAMLRGKDEYVVIGFGAVGQSIASTISKQPPATPGNNRSPRIIVLDRHLDIPKRRFAHSVGVQIVGRDVLLISRSARWVAGLHRAERVYVVAGTDPENLAIAAALSEQLGSRANRIWVHIDDYVLLERLRDIDPAEHGTQHVLPRYFCLGEAAVEKLLVQDAPVTDVMEAGYDRAHLAVVGADRFTRLLIENSALYASFGAPTFTKPKLTLISPDAEATVAHIDARHPTLREWIELETLAVAPDALCWLAPDVAISGVEATNKISHWIFSESHLPQALALYRGMTTGKRETARITVASAFDASQAKVAGAVSRTQRQGVDFYGAYSEAAPWSIALNAQLEQVARGFHERWRGPEDPSYEALPETMRISNWRAALHSLLKLRLIGFSTLNPCLPILGLTQLDLDRLRETIYKPELLAGLGQFEYIRWCVDRVLDGWTYALSPDDVRRTRPQLEHGRGNYQELGAADIQKDRDQIISLLETLTVAMNTLSRN